MDTRALFGGVVIGAALALAFDPVQGRRRRSLIRASVLRRTGVTGAVLDARAREMSHRARGLAAATRGRLWAEDVDDGRLLERVRSKLGRVGSHPHAIDAEVRDGEVTLRGPALAWEVRALLDAAASVRGVHAVINELEPHDSADGVPSLQGGRAAPSAFGRLPPSWARRPGALVSAAALAAGGLALACARR